MSLFSFKFMTRAELLVLEESYLVAAFDETERLQVKLELFNTAKTSKKTFLKHTYRCVLSLHSTVGYLNGLK